MKSLGKRTPERAGAAGISTQSGLDAKGFQFLMLDPPGLLFRCLAKQEAQSPTRRPAAHAPSLDPYMAACGQDQTAGRCAQGR